jgi:hypothetical protein
LNPETAFTSAIFCGTSLSTGLSHDQRFLSIWRVAFGSAEIFEDPDPDFGFTLDSMAK